LAQQDEDATAADEGDLEALVHEYVWETGAACDEAALMELVRLQHEAPVPQLYAEHLTTPDFLRFLLQVYLRAAADARAAAVHGAFATLQRFGEWAAATQDYHLEAALAGARQALVDEVERLQAAGQALRTGAGAGGVAAGRRPSL